MPPAIEELKNAILNDNECLEALEEFTNQARKEAKEIVKKHIQIKEPQVIDHYLEGYKAGYRLGQIDAISALYEKLEEDKEAGLEDIKNFLDALYKQGDTDANTNH